MILQNINGTTDNLCHCNSWLAHWERYAPHGNRNDPPSCSVAFCTNRDLVGAHVQKENGDKWYIVPLCKTHNQQVARLSVKDNTRLAPANVSMTCGQR